MSSPKYFTVDQANRTLPLVRRIVSDIMEEYRRWQENLFRYELIAAGSQARSGETDEQKALQRQVDDSAGRIQRYIDELTDVGCLFKGFEQGLVDFHSRHEGRDILLCWRLGEERVEYWHEVDAGFAGRQQLSA
jgi:hypothetical protein